MEQQFDPLNRRSEGLGDGSGCAAQHEVLENLVPARRATGCASAVMCHAQKSTKIIFFNFNDDFSFNTHLINRLTFLLGTKT